MLAWLLYYYLTVFLVRQPLRLLARQPLLVQHPNLLLHLLVLQVLPNLLQLRNLLLAALQVQAYPAHLVVQVCLPQPVSVQLAQVHLPVKVLHLVPFQLVPLIHLLVVPLHFRLLPVTPRQLRHLLPPLRLPVARHCPPLPARVRQSAPPPAVLLPLPP